MMLTATPVAADDTGLRDALTSSDLPTEDLNEPGRAFFRFERAGDAVGFGGFELYGADALLRSVVVLPDHRGNGLGTDMSRQLIALARQAGAQRVYLLTTTAAAFFTRLGFEPVDRIDAPPAILSTRQATTICSTAAMLSRSTNQ